MAVVLLLTLPAMAFAQFSVSIENRTTDGTRPVTLQVDGQVPAGLTGSWKLIFSFAADVFDVQGVVQADGDLFGCLPIGFETSLDEADETKGLLTIECDDVRDGIGRLFTLSIRAVRSSELIGNIRLESAFYNEDAQSNISSDGGVVTVTRDPVFFEDAESLGGNFPNPFLSSTEFPYTLASNNVEVQFTVFTNDGIKVYSQTEVGRKGANLWKFDPAQIDLQLSQGVFLLLMETPSGAYTLPFQHLR